ncbi:MAG: nucleotidyltransferase domain-containing protein [Armatimonadota bacterium]
MLRLNNLPKQLSRKINKEKLVDICRNNDIIFMALFGSFAVGTQRTGSDIDIIIKFDKSKEKSLLDLVHAENEFQKLFKRKVDLLTPGSLSPYLRNDILDSMRVIYEKK